MTNCECTGSIVYTKSVLGGLECDVTFWKPHVSTGTPPREASSQRWPSPFHISLFRECPILHFRPSERTIANIGTSIALYAIVLNSRAPTSVVKSGGMGRGEATVSDGISGIGNRIICFAEPRGICHIFQTSAHLARDNKSLIRICYFSLPCSRMRCPSFPHSYTKADCAPDQSREVSGLVSVQTFVKHVSAFGTFSSWRERFYDDWCSPPVCPLLTGAHVSVIVRFVRLKHYL